MLPVLLTFAAISLSMSSPDEYVAPSIVKSPPSKVIFQEGQQISLECQGKGTGPLLYEWRRNNQVLNCLEINSTRCSIAETPEGGSALIITSAVGVDEGYYQCIVSHNQVKVISNTTHLREAFLTRQSSSKAVHTVTVRSGAPFILYARKHSSYPPATYSWEVVQSPDDDRPSNVRLDRRVQVDEQYHLHFGYVIQSDSKIYRLSIVNEFLQKSLSCCFTRVTVLSEAHDVSKEFEPRPSFPNITTYFGIVGQAISLRCFFDAKPSATYQWRKQTGHLDNTRTSFQSDDTEMIIRNLRIEDEGYYLCFARNALSEKNVTMHLQVEASPSFHRYVDQPQSVSALEGQTATFSCNATAIPEASISWFINSNQINIGNQLPGIKLTHNRKILILEKVCQNCTDRFQLSHLVVIQCNASNVHGYVLGTGYLRLKYEYVSDSIIEASDLSENDRSSSNKFTIAIMCAFIIGPTLVIGFIFLISAVIIRRCNNSKKNYPKDTYDEPMNQEKELHLYEELYLSADPDSKISSLENNPSRLEIQHQMSTNERSCGSGILTNVTNIATVLCDPGIYLTSPNKHIIMNRGNKTDKTNKATYITFESAGSAGSHSENILTTITRSSSNKELVCNVEEQYEKWNNSVDNMYRTASTDRIMKDVYERLKCKDGSDYEVPDVKVSDEAKYCSLQNLY